MDRNEAVHKKTQTGIAGAVFDDGSGLEGLSEDILARVRARQVYSISRLTIPMMMANIVNATTLLVVMELSGQGSPAVWIWTATVFLFAAYTAFVWYRRRSFPFPEKLGVKTARRVIINAALLGAIWAAPGLLFLPTATGAVQSLLVALAAGMIVGGSMALYPLPTAALIYSSVIVVGSFLGYTSMGDVAMIGFATVTAAFFFVVAYTITRHADVFVSEFVGRLELDEKNALIEKLLKEVQSQANDERVKSERRLAKAQKMEAIGQLTGGIAHDFNNLLAAIQGHAELIELEKKTSPELTTPILRSTQRGSDLVRGLLSIARKQPLTSQSINVTDLIGQMVPLLERTLGGQIQIEQQVPDDLWSAHADLSQLESAILNLSLNARDAMPDGGSLTMACANAPAADHPILRRLEVASGDFVCVSISDTGHGMSKEVRQRALEPFFTTKKFGEGSGLGLSTVEGFCGQSGGHLWIDSTEGLGTTIYMFLPRAARQASAESTLARRAEVLPMGQSEHILVVEDDPEVRNLTTTMLEKLNYRTTWSPSADEALELMQSDFTFDLVLVDVRLPGKLNGLEFAEIVRREFPTVKPIVYSGYPAKPSATHRSIEFPFLRKPFSRRELAKIVAATLSETDEVDAGAAGDCAPAGARSSG
ncbi:MAG: ATP-binding protein [Pseudomonadota bacterium]